MYVIHRHWTVGRKSILRKTLFSFCKEEIGGKGYCSGDVSFVTTCCSLYTSQCKWHSCSRQYFWTAQLSFLLLLIYRGFGRILNASAFQDYFYKSNWELFWQQEAHKNIEKKKIKRLKPNSYERNTPLLPYPKPAKQSRITSKKDHLSTENHTSVCGEWMLPWPPCDCLGALSLIVVNCNSPVTFGHCREWLGEIGLSVASFLLHFSVC